MSSYLDQIKQIIDAYSNQTQASIIHLLFIYQRLSTTELAEKLNRAKSTVLRHLEHLVSTGLIAEEEVVEGRGRYPTKYYSMVRDQDMTIQGQKIRETGEQLTAQEFEVYLRSFQSRYILAREIMDQSVEYLECMVEQVRKVGDDTEELLKLGKNNLGEISFAYLTKSALWSKYYDKELPKAVSDDPELHEYMTLRLILPIRRLVEAINSDSWSSEDDIWPYSD